MINTYAASDAPEGSNNDPYVAGIQFMITRRMRRILENQLGYLDTEVDAMDPQIAAVVIDRKLARPTNGMPKSWEKTFIKTNNGLSNAINDIQSMLQSIGNGVKTSTKKYAKFVVPILLIWIAGPKSVPLISHIGASIKTSLARFSSIFKLQKRKVGTTKTNNNSIEKNQKDIENSTPAINFMTASKSSELASKPLNKKSSKNINNSPPLSRRPIINRQPILPPEFNEPNNDSTKLAIDKLSFEKATSLSFFDRIVVLWHLVSGK